MTTSSPAPAEARGESRDHASPHVARVANRYTIQEKLATGGMGVVYRVLDTVTGEERALKRIKARNGAVDRVALEAFEREYQVLAGLSHPRIIRVFDYGVDGDGPFYTMELVIGRDMRSAAPLPYRKACQYLRDVATSLALLHARRLIHRDLSPSNIRMTGDGHCKVLDFGALETFGYAKNVMGTPPVIPPEAVLGLRLDQRADLYALGAVGYWMLTGRHAFPVRQIADLVEAWATPPRAPSALVSGVPRELDALVLSLLSEDPLARPESAAEVIARLTAIADLPAEDQGAVELLAQSFLWNPRFTGRESELASIEERLEQAVLGGGGSVCIEGVAGMGRTRVLEEIDVRAQIARATTVFVDASLHAEPNGTARALVARLLHTLPDLSREERMRQRAALSALGHDVDGRFPRESMPPPIAGVDGGAGLEGWIAEIARTTPLVLLVDNVECADEKSLELLEALAAMAGRHRLLLVVTERLRREAPAAGLLRLRSRCARMALNGLDPERMLELARSLFGDAPHIERFAEWLHGRAAGGPRHCLELIRQLVTRQIIRYRDGFWVLPVERPDAELSAALEDALTTRVDVLSKEARALADCLSLQRGWVIPELCARLIDSSDAAHVSAVMEELGRCDVLQRSEEGYRFNSDATREALLAGMDDETRKANHRRLGEGLAKLEGTSKSFPRIEAGWHLIRGGDDLRGAHMIAAVASDSVAVRRLVADVQHSGEPFEAALEVYRRHGRSLYERMPLLAALGQAGFYEKRCWGEKYGDEALEVLAQISGLKVVRRLTPWFGRWLALVLGLAFACARFYAVPKRERRYSFAEVLVQLFSTVTTLTGAAAVSLDVERAARAADVLAPFAMLPERLTPAGIYQYCKSLEQIGREHQPEAYATFDTLLHRFEDPRYYPTLPDDARQLYINAGHFSRGAFAIFRENASAALESADALEASGMRLYTMIASQLRFFYYANRGELAKAMCHREQLEAHAAYAGSAWQVETWEAPAMIPVFAVLGDVVGSTRVADRLELLSQTVPSLTLYAGLSRFALQLVSGELASPSVRKAVIEGAIREANSRSPRSYIGWAAFHGFLARAHNESGDHAGAMQCAERALSCMVDADREYVALFLTVDIEAAHADAGLGRTAEALQRIDALLERFRGSDHPLLQGLLHEARARVAWKAGRTSEYESSLAEVERWFRPTETPALIAKCERLAALRDSQLVPSVAPTGAGFAEFYDASTVSSVSMDGASSVPFYRGASLEQSDAEDDVQTVSACSGSLEALRCERPASGRGR